MISRRVLLGGSVFGAVPAGFRLPTDFTEEAAEPTQLWRALQLDEANAQRGSHGYYAAAVTPLCRSSATMPTTTAFGRVMSPPTRTCPPMARPSGQ